MDKLFGIYVHWPFCKSKCPYCDFNSHVSDSVDHALWRSAFKKEIAHIAAITKGRTVTSIFFGGGTPSLMQPETVQSIIDDISHHWALSPRAEITLEANPTSIEANKFKDFKSAGINRVSVGVQSLNDHDLKFLGREHSAAEAINALKTASDIFDRFSFDLIYARPDQELTSWKEELKEALEYSKGHLSLYQLTIEQGTPFYIQHNRGDFKIPQQDLAADLYELTQDVMAAHHMPAYEISNHALKGHESLHNLTYWRYADYAGVGPGAHGRLTIDGMKQATRTHRAPDVWLSKAEESGHGYHDFERVDQNARLSECLMMGLRLSEGVLITRLKEEGGQDFDQLFDKAKVSALCDEGLIKFEGANEEKRLVATLLGMQKLNALLSYLLV